MEDEVLGPWLKILILCQNINKFLSIKTKRKLLKTYVII